MIKHIAVLIVLLGLAGGGIIQIEKASAQTLEQSQMIASPQMTLDKSGSVEWCGVGVMASAGSVTTATIFDVSLLLTKNGYGIAKLTAHKGVIKNGLPSLSPMKVYGGWLRAEGASAAQPINGYLAGDTPDAKLFVSATKPAIAFIKSILADEKIQIAISLSEGNNLIMYGKAQITRQQKDQITSCIGELLQRVDVD